MNHAYSLVTSNNEWEYGSHVMTAIVCSVAYDWLSLQVVTAPIGAILASTLQTVIGWNGMFFLVAGFTFVGE